MSDFSKNAQLVIKNALVASRLAKKVGNSLSIHGVSFTEYLLMHAVQNASQKMLSRNELAELLGMSASGITRMLAPMDKLGWVEKEANPRDARQSLVKLSPAGLRLYGDASMTFVESANDLLKNLSKDQQAQVMDAYASMNFDRNFCGL